MDRKAVEEALFQAAETVLETAALTWAEAADEVCGMDEWKGAIAARMDFGGRGIGFAAVALPDELGAILAVNMLGIEEAQGSVGIDAADAAKELLNMTGMLVAEALFGGMEITVSPPREIPVADYRELARRPEPVKVGIVTEDSYMELLLFLQGEETEERFL